MAHRWSIPTLFFKYYKRAKRARKHTLIVMVRSNFFSRIHRKPMRHLSYLIGHLTCGICLLYKTINIKRASEASKEKYTHFMIEIVFYHQNPDQKTR